MTNSKKISKKKRKRKRKVEQKVEEYQIKQSQVFFIQVLKM